MIQRLVWSPKSHDENLKGSMVVIWTVVAYVLSLVVTNLTWLLLPVAFVVLRINADPLQYASGELVSHKVVNFFIGNAAGFWSITIARWFLSYVQVDSVVPLLLIGALLIFSSLAQLKRSLTPYSNYGVVGELIGLIFSLLMAVTNR